MKNESQITLQSGRRQRVRQGHPWVFAGEIRSKPNPRFDGQSVVLKDERGRFLGVGIYNSQSQIVWRRFSRDSRAVFERDFLQRAIKKAVNRRPDGSFRRLVWSEADDLPGLIVDQFDTVLVVQAVTLAVDQRLPVIGEILSDLLKPEALLFRNDAPTRRHEGLPLEVKTADGRDLPPKWFAIDGMEYFLDLQKGQKTGFYLDQREEHTKVASFAKGRNVLDGFCNQGSFALHCARAGAASVTAVEISAECVALAKKNALRNGLEVDFLQENLFDYLTARRKEKYGLIILDPPSFARNRRAVEGALRGYKEINLRALRMLESGGILATYSCSRHVDRALFREVLGQAAGDAGRRVEVIAQTGQPADHPVLLTMPESEYLKGCYLRVD